MKNIFIVIVAFGMIICSQNSAVGQNRFPNIMTDKLSFTSKNIFKTIERQFERLEIAISNSDYRTAVNNIKYIKKGVQQIKQNDPNIDLSQVESEILQFESKLGDDPVIAEAEKEAEEAKIRQANLEKEREAQKLKLAVEEKKGDLEFAKKLSSQGYDVSRNAMGEAGPNKKLDFLSARVWPGVTLHSLLASYSGLNMSLDGKLQTPKLVFSFLPPNLEGGGIPNYNGFKKDEVMITAEVINKATKQKLGVFYYGINPYQNTFSNGVQHTGNGYDKVVQMKEGEYELKFYGTGTHFFTFPFEVIKKRAESPYSVYPEVFFLKGSWEDWAYLSVTKLSGSDAILLTFYQDYTNPEVENEYKQDIGSDVMYKASLFKGTQKIGLLKPKSGVKEKSQGNYHRINTATRGTWVTMGAAFAKLDWDGDSDFDDYLDLKKLGDGQYKIVLDVQDASNIKSSKVFRFKILGGKMVGHDSTTRGKHSNKYSFMESGLGYTFIKAE